MNFWIKLFFLVFLFFSILIGIGYYKNNPEKTELKQIRNENLKGFDFLKYLKKKVFKDLEEDLIKKNERNRNN